MADLVAERAILSSVFNYGAECYDEVSDLVTVRSFSDETNQSLYSCAEYVLKEHPEAKLDYPSLMSSAKSLGITNLLEGADQLNYIRAIFNFPAKKQNARRLAAKVRKLEIARLLKNQLDEARSNLSDVTGDEPVDKILALAEGPIFDFTSLLTGQDSGPKLMGEGAEAYIQHLIDNPREMIGISTGMPHYDFSIGGGLRENSLDVVVARIKTGKSFLVDNIALHIAGKQNIPVFNCDTEMNWEEHVHRVAAHLSGVPIREIETGKFAFKDVPKHKVVEAAKRLKDIPYYYESLIGKSFEEVLASMRRWVTRTVGLQDNGKAKPCVIIYDYLKMMSADFLSGDLKEYQALGFITTALKNFVGKYATRCFCLAQMNRDGIEKEDSSVVGGSDRIAHYATSVSIYKWKSDEERAEASGDDYKYTHKMIPIVTRHGEGLRDGNYINIQAEYHIGRIIEGPTREQVFNKTQPNQQKGTLIDDQQATEPVQV